MKFLDSKTERGFHLIEFIDLYGSNCSLQKSSLATDDAVWLGVDDACPKILGSHVTASGVGWVHVKLDPQIKLTTRMHLSRDQVRAMLPILERFVETGELEPEGNGDSIQWKSCEYPDADEYRSRCLTGSIGLESPWSEWTRCPEGFYPPAPQRLCEEYEYRKREGN